MADRSPERPPGGQPGRQLGLVLLLGVAGAGAVLLAMRQGWAQVQTTAPKPLPAGLVTATGQDLVPAAGALAVAALASLAAVLATRRLARRLTGIVLAGLGASIAATVAAGASSAAVLAAAAAAAGPGSGTGAGTAAGSVTAGGAGTAASGGTGVDPVAGLPGHVVFLSFPWRGVALAGAIALIASGALVTWRAGRLPVMSSRFDRPAPAGPARPAVKPGHARPAVKPGRSGQPAGDAAAIWESLNRGEDPTAGEPGETGAGSAS